MEVQEIKDKNQWEGFFESVQEKTFLQAWNWGEFNKAMNQKVWRWGIFGGLTQSRSKEKDEKTGNHNLVAVAQVLKIRARRGTFLFLPHGPILKEFPISNFQFPENFQFPISKKRVLEIFLKKLKEVAKEEGASFIRVAPLWERNEENRKIFRDLGFRQAPIHIHPEVTWQLDITKPEQELLMGMRKTTRYLIRKGLKDDNLTVFQSRNLVDLETFNQIYQKTAQRHKFSPFSFAYLKKQFLAFLPDEQISLFLAQYKGEVIAGAVIVFWQGRAFYHHGASLKSHPRLPTSYLLQWEAIREAKKRGCKIYNFWGIAKEDSNFQKHPWAGLTLFKKGFGGFKKEYLKTQDYILSPKYLLNFIVEKIRKMRRGY